MAAAMNFSDLYGVPTWWDNPTPDYSVLCDHYGVGAPPSAADECRDGLVQASARSPIVVAFVTPDDCDGIYVSHSLTIFPGDVTDPTALDGLAIGLVGDRPATATAVAFPNVSFEVVTQVAHDMATLLGPAGHSAAPPVFRTGPHAAGDAGTVNTSGRRVMVLPPELAGLVLSGSPVDGRYTLLGFYNQFISAHLAGTAAQRDLIKPLADWWRLASTNDAAGVTIVASDLVASGTPRLRSQLSSWGARVVSDQLARLGSGGPPLTGAAFARGVADIRATLEENNLQTLEFHRDSKVKSFTEVHGASLAQLVQRFCNVATDADLPPVHHLLLKTGRGFVHGALTALFAERALATDLPITPSTAPIATARLVDDVFRQYMPASSGLNFGKGLTPFAMVCDGHEGFARVRENALNAARVEAGATVSLADASTITSEDVRFPTVPYVAVEKLCAWSVVLDVFHGVLHPVAMSVRNAVRQLAPQLQRLATAYADSTDNGMELICRVLFDMQQDYFAYINRVATAGVAPVPTFDKLLDLVATHRADQLSGLPRPWYDLVSCPKSRESQGTRVPNNAPAAMRTPAASSTAVNPHADPELTRRYQAHGASSIKAMIDGRDIKAPLHAGKEVCMSWALRGSCYAGCKRARQHVRYGASVVTALHKVLDDCGVANPQP